MDSTAETAKILKTGIHGVVFKNWSETFSCTPEVFFVPKSETEIQQVLKAAKLYNKKVRVVGCRHSPSDIACTDGYMVSLQYFNKVLEIDKLKHQVKVQCGMVISELNEVLYSHNLALSVLGSVSEVTIGGVICTGTHGTGINYGTMASYVIQLDLMLHDGTIKTCSMNRDQDMFLAALCSLGALGIILNVTLQCEPAFNLDLKQYTVSLQDVIENLDVHLSCSEHFRFMWFPYTDSVVVCHSSRTDAPVVKEPWTRKLIRWFWDYAVGYYTLEFLYFVSTFCPNLVPSINRLYYNLMVLTSDNRVDRSFRVFNFECLFKQHVNEWAIPKDKAGVALWKLRDWLELNGDVKVHFPVEVRFAKADHILISPAHGRDTCYINVIMYRPYGKNVPYKDYWSAYEKIMAEAEGRPHWAKAHSITGAKFRTMYPFFEKWCAIRQRVDPFNVFTNRFVERVLNNGV